MNHSSVCCCDARNLNARVAEIVDSKLRERLAQLYAEDSSAKTANQAEEKELEADPLVWNINAMSVLCWKGWTWPDYDTGHQKMLFKNCNSNRTLTYKIEAQKFMIRFFLCCFPLMLSFLEATILVGITDQGSTIKRMIYGDGYFQSPLWRYSRTSSSRDSFKSVFGTNGTIVGFTANILKSRPASEASRCMASEDLMATNAFVWTSDDAETEKSFSKLVDRLKPNASWLFAHCLPWEYANLCANVLRSSSRRTSWDPPQCTLPDPNAHPLMSVELWDSLAASPEEIRQSHADAMVPRRLEGQADLALWVVTRQVCDAKSLAFFDDSFSSFLYVNVNYLYRISLGEAYLVELVTIATLSFFLFYTSFLAEAQQLMHQVTLSCALRCYEDPSGPFGPGLVSIGSGEAASGSELARGGGLASSLAGAAALGLSDFACDLFLSLRIIFLSYMVMCTEMITTWVSSFSLSIPPSCPSYLPFPR
jgi:hypothetical protein